MIPRNEQLAKSTHTTQRVRRNSSDDSHSSVPSLKKEKALSLSNFDFKSGNYVVLGSVENLKANKMETQLSRPDNLKKRMVHNLRLISRRNYLNSKNVAAVR